MNLVLVRSLRASRTYCFPALRHFVTAPDACLASAQLQGQIVASGGVLRSSSAAAEGYLIGSRLSSTLPFLARDVSGNAFAQISPRRGASPSFAAAASMSTEAATHDAVDTSPEGGATPGNVRGPASTDGEAAKTRVGENMDDEREMAPAPIGPYLLDPDLPMPSLITPPPKPKPVPLDVLPALQALRNGKKRKFEQSVEVAMRLGIDPRRGDQMVRGATTLPHGTGKTVRVAVFTIQDTELAKAAGADVVGGEDLVGEIQAAGSGAINFDKVLATADIMPKMARIARILGPRGLMPNPKLGTIVAPGGLAEAVRTMKAGRIEYRADKGGVVHAGIGKLSFPDEHLLANFGSFAASIMAARPKGAKGSGVGGYVHAVHLSTTMGRGVPVALSSMVTAISEAGKRR